MKTKKIIWISILLIAFFSILANLGLPSAFFKSLPFMITLVALAITSKHDRAPKASGQPYDKSMR